MYCRLHCVRWSERIPRLAIILLGCLLSSIAIGKLLLHDFSLMKDLSCDRFRLNGTLNNNAENSYLERSPKNDVISKLNTTQKADLYMEFVAAMNDHRPSQDSMKWRTKSWPIPRLDQLIDDPQWPSMMRFENVMLNDADVATTAVRHKAFVEVLPDFEPLVDFEPGTTGIVYMGGDNYTEILYTTIRLLRRTGCKLPIEIFLPSQEQWDPWLCDGQYEAFDNIVCKVLMKPAGYEIERFQYKAFALLQSTFENVLCLDADNFPVTDPSIWFTHPEYVRTGFISWLDFWISTRSSQWHLIADIAPTTIQEERTHETGQLMISRSAHARTLLLAAYYNLHGPSFFYIIHGQWTYGQGDKETYFNAAEALSLPRHTVSTFVAFEGFLTTPPHPYFRLIGMSQPDPFESSGSHIGLMHQQGVKLLPDTIVRELEIGSLVNRMYGPRSTSNARFGYDVEAVVWQELVATTCTMQRYSLDTCSAVVRHWSAIQAADEKRVD